MVVKKYQKGGLHNEKLSEYFSKIIELLKKIHNETEGKKYNLETFTKIIENNSNNILFDALLGKLNKKLSQITNNNRTNILKFKKDFYKTIFRSITNFIDTKSFIAKLLNIYIYMLFIKYLISLKKEISGRDTKVLFFSSLFGMFLHTNVNQNLENMRIKSRNIQNTWILNENHFTEELLGRIKKLFIEKYSRRVPIFYGNDYVGNLSIKNKKYIINPVGAFILKLYKSNIFRYKKILFQLFQSLFQLLQSVIGSNKIPYLKYLDYKTEFCIIKEQNHEKICEKVGDCSRIPSIFRSSLYGNRIIAEITEENIASDEHILELLDILLNLFLEKNNILQTNLNRNEVEQPILSELRPKTLNNQRRLFAEGAQSKVLPNNNF
jgi:hypothetical protein